jgi:hypothetical protein
MEQFYRFLYNFTQKVILINPNTCFENRFFLADTSPTVNNLMRLGGISSRVFGLVSFGRLYADGRLG